MSGSQKEKICWSTKTAPVGPWVSVEIGVLLQTMRSNRSLEISQSQSNSDHIEQQDIDISQKLPNNTSKMWWMDGMYFQVGWGIEHLMVLINVQCLEDMIVGYSSFGSTKKYTFCRDLRAEQKQKLTQKSWERHLKTRYMKSSSKFPPEYCIPQKFNPPESPSWNTVVPWETHSVGYAIWDMREMWSDNLKMSCQGKSGGAPPKFPQNTGSSRTLLQEYYGSWERHTVRYEIWDVGGEEMWSDNIKMSGRRKSGGAATKSGWRMTAGLHSDNVIYICSDEYDYAIIPCISQGTS